MVNVQFPLAQNWCPRYRKLLPTSQRKFDMFTIMVSRQYRYIARTWLTRRQLRLDLKIKTNQKSYEIGYAVPDVTTRNWTTVERFSSFPEMTTKNNRQPWHKNDHPSGTFARSGEPLLGTAVCRFPQGIAWCSLVITVRVLYRGKVPKLPSPHLHNPRRYKWYCCISYRGSSVDRLSKSIEHGLGS